MIKECQKNGGSVTEEEKEQLKEKFQWEEFKNVLRGTQIKALHDFCSKYDHKDIKCASDAEILIMHKKYVEFMGNAMYNYLEQEIKRRKVIKEIKDMKGEDGIKSLKRRELIKEMKQKGFVE